MLLTSWLSSLRSSRLWKRSQRKTARKSIPSFVRQAEQLEDRTLLTALIIEPMDLTGTPGTGIKVENVDLIGSGTMAMPEFDSLVIETVATDSTILDRGIEIDLSNIALTSLVIESSSITNFDGIGIEIDLTNVTGLTSFVIDSVNVTGGGGAGLDIDLNGTDIENFVVFDSTIAGIRIAADGSVINNGRILENTINAGIGVDGIELELRNGATANGFAIGDNLEISSVTEDNIVFDFSGTPVDGLRVEDNQFSAGTNLGLDFLIDGDTFTQPFSITNSSSLDQKLTRFRLDVSGAGLEFDVNASTGIPFTPVGGTEVTTLLDPISGLSSSTVLDLTFADFDSGETFQWNIDLDVPGTQSHIPGNDLIGSAVELEFSDGTTTSIITGTLVAVPGFPDAAKFVSSSGGSGGTGINFKLLNSNLTNLNIDDNELQGNNGYGFLFNADTSDISGRITNNEINAVASDGVAFNLIDSNLTGDILNNAIGASGGDGVSFTPTLSASGVVNSANSAGTIVITSIGHGLMTGDRLIVAGMGGEDPTSGEPLIGPDNAANGVFTITVTGADTFSLDGSTANAIYTGGGTWFRSVSAGNVTDATMAGPVNIESVGHGLTTGDTVTVQGVLGNLTANGTFTVTFVDSDNFTLDDSDSTGSEAYTKGGVWYETFIIDLQDSGVDGNVAAASNPSVGPIEITDVGHGLTGGETVTVHGVLGNLSANGKFTVTIVDADHFTLDSSSGSGTYTTGGVWYETRGSGSVVGNAFSANTGAGIGIDLPAGTVFLGDFRQNTIENNGGIGFDLSTTAGSFDVNIGSVSTADTNNFDRNVGAGVAVSVLDSGSGSYEVRNNLFTNSQNDPTSTVFNGAGFHTRLEGNSPFVEASSILAVSVIDGNTFGVDNIGNVDSGALFTMQEGTNIDVLNLTNNTFINNGNDGFRFIRRDDANLNKVLVADSTFENNLGDGIDLFAQNTTIDLLDWELRDNEITNNENYGIRIRVEADARVEANLTNNTVDFNGSMGGGHGPGGASGGIGLSGFQQVEVHMDMTDNRIRNNIGDGFSADTPLFFDTMKLVGDWTGNIYDDNSLSGVRTDGIAFGSLDWTDNSFNTNGDDGARLQNGDDFFVYGLNNDFIGNAKDGLNLGQAVSAILGDGSFPNVNVFQNNGNDGLVLSQGTSAYLGTQTDSAGNGRGKHVTVKKGLFLDNMGDGIDANVSSTGLVIDNISIINGNHGDGIEWRSTGGTNTLSVEGRTRITENGGNGTGIGDGTGTGGRGIDVLNATGGTLYFTVLDSTISSNAYEGIYVVNTAAGAQQQARSDDPLLATGSVFANPHIEMRVRDNFIESNGNPFIPSTISTGNPASTVGTLGGLVVRVGSVATNGAIGQPSLIQDLVWGPGSMMNDFVPGMQLEDVDGAPAAGVDAEILNNIFNGNYGSEIYFDPFTSTVDPATTQGFWNFDPVDDPTYRVDVLERDPLSRFDLVFRGNETNLGGGLDVTNGSAFYDNNESEFKSRSGSSSAPQHTHANGPAGPFSGTRLRNATRTLGEPAMPLAIGFPQPDPPAPPNPLLYFAFDGLGRSTWRVESNYEIENDFFTGEIPFGFSDFNTVAFTSWDSGTGTAGNPDNDPFSLGPNDLFNDFGGAAPDLDMFEGNDSFVAAHDFGTVSGSGGTVNGVPVITANINNANDHDYFKFTANATGTATFVLNGTPTGFGDLNLDIWRVELDQFTEEVLIGGGTGMTSDESVTRTVTEGTTYFVRVSDANVGTHPEYVLTINLPTPLTAASSETETAGSESTENSGGSTHANTPVEQATPSISEAALATIVDAAITRWSNTGLTDAQITHLESVSVELADLSGFQLASASNMQVLIDLDAASYGWFVDDTPLDDSEFSVTASSSRFFADASSEAAGQMDLLTTVMHELGHTLGLADLSAIASPNDIMSSVLVDGERRLPIVGQAEGLTVTTSNGETHFLAGPITVDFFAADTVDANVGDDIVADAGGNISLRAAIMEANASAGDDVININPGTVALTIDNDGEDGSLTGDLDITDNLIINGSGVDVTFIDATAIYDRIFHILAENPNIVEDPLNPTNNDVTVTISNLTIMNGSSVFGGGIFNAGTLILDNVDIVSNFAVSRGGGIYNSGTLTVNDTTISNNNADSRGGALYNVVLIDDSTGSIISESSVTITNSTLSGNTASSRAGAIFNEGAVTMTNTTISGNTANSSGGGIFNENTLLATNATIVLNTTLVKGGGIMNPLGSTATLQSTIVADNTAAPTLGFGPDLFGAFNTLGGNLIGDIVGGSGITNGLDGDQTGGGFIPVIDPLLLPLGDYGGPTETHFPGLTSPVRDTGVNTSPTSFDQRGLARVTDGNNDTVNVIDVGAVESNPLAQGGFVWQDSDDDGIQEVGEPGIPGVTVELFNAGLNGAIGGGDDVSVGTVMTNAQGLYLFPNLFVGTYFVQVDLPAGHTRSPQNAGGDDDVDSDVSATTGFTEVFDLTGGAFDKDQDAGLKPQPANISGTAFNDNNGTSIQDTGDTNLAGVGVELFSVGPNGAIGGGDDVSMGTDTTDAMGDYDFMGLAAGVYYLTFSTPAGLALTAMDAGGDDTLDSDVNPYSKLTDAFTLIAGSTDDTRDAGYVTESTIGNLVFGDIIIQNGIQDIGEPGAGPVTVTLFEAGADNMIGGGDDTTIGTDLTVAGIGVYEFSNLAAGDYYLHFTKPADFVFTTQDQGVDDMVDSDVDPATQQTDVFALGSGVNDDTRDAGIISQAKLGDTVWTDTNRNGILDPGELGLAGVSVTLFHAGADGAFGGTGANADIGMGTVITSATGAYEFDSLDAGNYYLVVGEPIDFDFTIQNAGANPLVDSEVDPATGRTGIITLTSGLDDNTRDIGFVHETQVGDRVWADTNKDGSQGFDELGVENVEVKLHSPGVDGIIGTGDDVLNVKTTMTDVNGDYILRELVAGDYYLEFVTPTGFALTKQDAGGVDFIDSDPDPLTGLTDVFTLVPGAFDTFYDAGLVPGATASGYVWRDLDQNGLQTAGEPAVPNVQVDLLNVGEDGVIGGGDDRMVATTLTDTNGLYSFTDLPEGEYYVLFADPAGFIFTLADQGGDDTIDSDADFSGLSHAFSLVSTQIDDTIDAGLITHTDARIGNLVFLDLNGDGIQQPGDFGVAGVRVRLFSVGENRIIDTEFVTPDDEFKKETFTNANGRYAFTNLAPDIYFLTFDEPTGFAYTLQDQGGNDSFDSDVDPEDGLIDAFQLNSGGNNQTIDSGLVDLNMPPGRPVITGPAAMDDEPMPTITWNPVPGAVTFDILLYNKRLGQQVDFGVFPPPTGIVGEMYTLPFNLAPDDYQVFVQAANAHGHSAFSEGHEFIITGPALTIPAVPVNVMPLGSIVDTTPTISWDTVPEAERYELRVYNIATGQEVVQELNLTSNSHTLGMALTGGTHTIYVRAVNAVGASGYNTGNRSFTLSGGMLTTPVVTSPGDTPNTTPTINWTASGGSGTTYEIQIYNIALGQRVINESTADAFFTPPSPLGPGEHSVYVRAINGPSSTPNSDVVKFTVTTGVALTPTLFNPASITNVRTPDYQWTGIASASLYELEVYNVDAGSLVYRNLAISPSTSLVSGNIFHHIHPTSAAFPLGLGNGNYRAFLRAVTPSGPTGYSIKNFEVISSIVEPGFTPEANTPEPGSLEIPLFEVEAATQFAGLFENDSFNTSEFESVETVARINESEVSNFNEADVSVVREYGWRKDETAPVSANESLDAVLADWDELEWWVDDNALANNESSESSDAEDHSEYAIAGAFVGLGVQLANSDEKRKSKTKKSKSRKRQ